MAYNSNQRTSPRKELELRRNCVTVVTSESLGLLIVVHQFLLDALPSREVKPSGGVTVRDKLAVELSGAAAKHGILLALVRASVVEPGTPADGRGAGVRGEAGGHLELELPGEAVGAAGGEAGLGVLLLGFHVDVHVAHGGGVGEGAHPGVVVLPRLPVDGDRVRLLRRARRVGGRRRGRWGRGLGPPVGVAAEQ